VEEAQRRFLRTIDDLPFGNSVFFPISKVLKVPWDPLHHNVVVAVNRTNLVIFENEPRQVLMEAKITNIIKYNCTYPILYLEVISNDMQQEIELETIDAALVCRMIKTHQRDLGIIPDRRSSSTRAGLRHAISDVDSRRALMGMEKKSPTQTDGPTSSSERSFRIPALSTINISVTSSTTTGGSSCPSSRSVPRRDTQVSTASSRIGSEIVTRLPPRKSSSRK